MEKEIIKQTEQNEAPDNRRTVFIGAKVSPRQKEHIKSLAEQCGMTVSDYLLARAYNYKPKARLTKEEAALLQNLDNCRADLVKYTSAFHGMSASQRHMMFNQIPFMVKWWKRPIEKIRQKLPYILNVTTTCNLDVRVNFRQLVDVKLRQNQYKATPGSRRRSDPFLRCNHHDSCRL